MTTNWRSPLKHRSTIAIRFGVVAVSQHRPANLRRFPKSACFWWFATETCTLIRLRRRHLASPFDASHENRYNRRAPRLCKGVVLLDAWRAVSKQGMAGDVVG